MASPPTPTANHFIARCLRGEVKPADIIDEIVRWNEGVRSQPIHLHLGMTEAEWSQYMEAESNLEKILQERRTRHLHRPQPQRPAGRRF